MPRVETTTSNDFLQPNCLLFELSFTCVTPFVRYTNYEIFFMNRVKYMYLELKMLALEDLY